jgi:hypothetical protein
MVHDEHNYSSDDGDKHAVQIEAGHTGMAGKFKQIAANKRANNRCVPRTRKRERLDRLAACRTRVFG